MVFVSHKETLETVLTGNIDNEFRLDLQLLQCKGHVTSVRTKTPILGKFLSLRGSASCVE